MVNNNYNIITSDNFNEKLFNLIFNFGIEIFIGLFISCLVIYLAIYKDFYSNLKKQVLFTNSLSNKIIKLSIIALIAILILNKQILTKQIYNLNSNIYISKFIKNFFWIDFYSQNVKILLIITMLCLMVLFIDYYYTSYKNILEFPILLIFLLFFSTLLVSSFDLFTAFITLEGISLLLYILIALDFESSTSLEASLKYFCMGAFASGINLFAISLIYGNICNFIKELNINEKIKLMINTNLELNHQTISIESIDHFSNTNFYFIKSVINLIVSNKDLYANELWVFKLAVILLVFVFLIKMAVFPCHVWSPDVYEGTTTPITTVLAVFTKLVIFLVFFRIFNFVFIEIPIWKDIIIYASIGSIIIGTFGAWLQKKIKRFIAYSSISHMGYLTLGMTSDWFLNIYSLLYLLIYIIMSIAFFAILLGVKGSVTGKPLIYITDLHLIGNNSVRFYLTFIILSMAGMPPLAGFFSKFFILYSLLNLNSYNIVFILLILHSISVFYYIRFLKCIWFNSKVERREIHYYLPNSMWSYLILNIFIFFIVFFMVFFNRVFNFIHENLYCLDLINLW